MAWKFWRGDELIARTEQANNRAIKTTLEAIGEKSDQQVPLDEGTLLRSKFIKVETGSGVISYGGGSGTGHPRVPYAVRWHEKEANFQHNRKKRYLADPVNEHGSRLYRKSLAAELGGVW